MTWSSASRGSRTARQLPLCRRLPGRGLIDGDGTVIEVGRFSWWWSWLRHAAPLAAASCAILTATWLLQVRLGTGRAFPELIVGILLGTGLTIWLARRRRRDVNAWVRKSQVDLLLQVSGASSVLTDWAPEKDWTKRVVSQMVVVGQGGLGLVVDREVCWLRERGVSLVVCCTAGGFVRDCTFLGPGERRVTVFATGRLARAVGAGQGDSGSSAG